MGLPAAQTGAFKATVVFCPIFTKNSTPLESKSKEKEDDELGVVDRDR